MKKKYKEVIEIEECKQAVQVANKNAVPVWKLK